MCRRQIWAGAAIALTALSSAASAEVTVSHSNDPTAIMGASIASLLGAEHKTVEAMPASKLAALAIGPAVEPKKKGGAAAAVAPAIVQYNAAWLGALPAPTGDGQWQCLTIALYFESRGETVKGQFAVAEVILNRVDSPAYPKSVCGVVQQGCQFSYTCDGRSEAMNEGEAADVAGRIARVMLDGAPRALTQGATHFHTVNVNPNWSRRFPQTASIGAHLFYRQP